MFHVSWEFRVRAGLEAEFERRYGPEGDWARLFRQGAGYVRTTLDRDLDLRGRYLLRDTWTDRAAHDVFKSRFAAAYAALDRECEALTVDERCLGTFVEVAAPQEGWRPSLGAWPDGSGVRFRVWAPERGRVELVVEGQAPRLLRKDADGTHEGFVAGLPAGARYRYRLDGHGPFPDPVSRFQPEGVHGPSEIVDPPAFAWTDAAWRGRPLEDLVVYELHVGTFTPEGTFAAAAGKLDALRDLGVTAIELMPVADFPGARNWGYDGVSLFAPARCYGRPDDLRCLVDRAHGIGIAVLLDVVYNHFGPDGAYQGAFSPRYFTRRHSTPWGQAINLDGAGNQHVRDYFVENALHWIHEYHVDGLRLDATHALFDDSERPFLAELSARVRAATPGRDVWLIAEDHRNLSRMVRAEADGGWGLDSQWSDDFHHQMRRRLTGDRDAYFSDFTDSVAEIAVTIRDGWFYKGQHSAHYGSPRGSDPSGLDPSRFVFFLQNHDQVGNRAAGERLHHQVDLATYRAASVALLASPEMPLLFMGQEWAARAPFLFFTDHHEELGRRVTEGRRREFKRFAAFADAAARARIPDPQAEETFRRSRLDWSEIDRPPHAATRRLYQAVLRLRREDPLLRTSRWRGFTARAEGDGALVLVRRSEEGGAVVAVIHLGGAGRVQLGADEGGDGAWSVLLQTEDPAYADDPSPIAIDHGAPRPVVVFARPGAVILRLSPSGRS